MSSLVKTSRVVYCCNDECDSVISKDTHVHCSNCGRMECIFCNDRSTDLCTTCFVDKKREEFNTKKRENSTCAISGCGWNKATYPDNLGRNHIKECHRDACGKYFCRDCKYDGKGGKCGICKKTACDECLLVCKNRTEGKRCSNRMCKDCSTVCATCSRAFCSHCSHDYKICDICNDKKEELIRNREKERCEKCNYTMYETDYTVKWCRDCGKITCDMLCRSKCLVCGKKVCPCKQSNPKAPGGYNMCIGCHELKDNKGKNAETDSKVRTSKCAKSLLAIDKEIRKRFQETHNAGGVFVMRPTSQFIEK